MNGPFAGLDEADASGPMPSGRGTNNSLPPPRDLFFAGGAMRFAPDRIPEPSPALFDPATPGLRATPVGVGGRQAAWYVHGPGLDNAVLRQYRRGGLIARLSHDHYFWAGAGRTRSFAEFDLMHFMAGRGLPVPRPLAAAYWRSGPVYRAALLTECIPQARALAKMLEACNPQRVAGAIYAMHEAGVWHADLNAFNILIDHTGKVWLIDFDRGRRRTMTSGPRTQNLQRLRRSLVKVAGAAGDRYWLAVNQAYTGLMAA